MSLESGVNFRFLSDGLMTISLSPTLLFLYASHFVVLCRFTYLVIYNPFAPLFPAQNLS